MIHWPWKKTRSSSEHANAKKTSENHNESSKNAEENQNENTKETDVNANEQAQATEKQDAPPNSPQPDNPRPLKRPATPADPISSPDTSSGPPASAPLPQPHHC